MNWRDFLVLASRLATGTTEADWRTGVSRAYYAAFHVARRLFADLNFTVPRADRAHQYLVYRLSNCGESPVEQAGRDLETLRWLRNRADYDEVPALMQPQAAAGRFRYAPFPLPGLAGSSALSHPGLSAHIDGNTDCDHA